MSNTQNVDPNEIRKFEELASRWWDKNSEFKPLHDINPLRANWIDNLALYTQVTKKKSKICYAHGRVLFSALTLSGKSDNEDTPIIFSASLRSMVFLPFTDEYDYSLVDANASSAIDLELERSMTGLG